MPLLLDATPLFEEERDLGDLTLISKRDYPFLFYRPRSGTTFSTSDQPSYTVKASCISLLVASSMNTSSVQGSSSPHHAVGSAVGLRPCR
jgi:hypothetical protein